MEATNGNNTEYLNDPNQKLMIPIRMKNFYYCFVSSQRYLRHSVWSICLNIDFESNFVLFYKAFLRISNFL